MYQYLRFMTDQRVSIVTKATTFRGILLQVEEDALVMYDEEDSSAVVIPFVNIGYARVHDIEPGQIAEAKR